MKNLAILSLSLLTLGLVGCSGLSSSAGSASLVSDVTVGLTCVGEAQAAAPACLAEVPACVTLGKTVSAPVAPKK